MNVLGRISVVGGGKITIGDNFYFSSGDAINPIGSNLQGAILTDSHEARISIGDNLYFSSGEAVNPIGSNLQGAILTDRPEARISIGDNVGMSSTRMWIHDSLTVGNNVNIGACVLIIDTDCHEMDYRVRNHSLPQSEEDGQYVKSAPIKIEDDVWIGAHSIILKGVTIGARSIIGAGSVVTKSIPADCIAAGNPCKVIRMLSHSNP